MLIEIWSDVVCPWCYIGKRRFETALSGFEHRDHVEVRFRSFELDPRAPLEREGPYAERLAEKYGAGLAEAEAMIARMSNAAAAEGIDMRFDVARPGNTFDAHRLLHLAARHGRQPEVKERLFAATFTEGLPISEPATLGELAEDAGLPAGAAAEVVSSDQFADEVRADEEEAARLGVTGVPFFVLGRRYAVGGAQRPEVLLDILRRAWAERPAAASA